MKILNLKVIGFVVFSLLSINPFTLTAQETREELDTIHLAYSKNEFQNYVNHIAYDEDFNYRSELRKSRDSKKEFILDTTAIMQTHLLKILKRAARRSDSVKEFRAYFIERNLNHISTINSDTLSSLYYTFRRNTLSGYLDDLDKAFGSL